MSEFKSEYNTHHWKVDFVSNLWILQLLAMLLVNAVLIVGFQVWFVYDLDRPEEALAAYGDYEILDSEDDGKMFSWLLASPDGEKVILTVEEHILFRQYRAMKPKALPEDGATRFAGDAVQVHITVNQDSIRQYAVSNFGLSLLRNMPALPMVYLLWGTVMISLEVAAWLLIRKLRGR